MYVFFFWCICYAGVLMGVGFRIIRYPKIVTVLFAYIITLSTSPMPSNWHHWHLY